MNILADRTLPPLHPWFAESFRITLYHSEQEIPELLPSQDILLCRSTLKVTQQLLSFGNLQCIATASSGSEHINLAQDDLLILDAKGSNARSVADYVVATLAYLSTQGYPLGKKAGIIGYGYVGQAVRLRLEAIGFQTIFYDPFKKGSCIFEELFTCSLLCIHPNWHETEPHQSVNLCDASFLQQLAPNTILINASRGGIVHEEALLKSPLIYCTDVYQQEPNINPKIIEKATLCTPHIAGHSIEAKLNAIITLSQKLHQHFGLPIKEASKELLNLPIPVTSPASWQEIALACYNPEHESLMLKKATDKKEAFLSLRKAHTFRHDFNQYFLKQPLTTKKILC